MRAQHLKNIQEQQERLGKLKQRQVEKESELAELKAQYMQYQDELAEVEKKMKTASEQKQRLLDYGGDDKKIQTFVLEISVLEERGMELLEKLEQNETERADAKQFLTGLEKTTKEIADEVNTEAEKEKAAIANLDLRLSSLKAELPSDFKAQLDKLLSKNLAHGPFTRIEQGSCFFCRYKISRMDESEIDMQKNLKTCPQCSRIFIPYGT